MMPAPITAATKLARATAGLRQRLMALPRKLAGDRSGVAMVEFAFTAPIVLAMGMLGTETAYYVITHMQVSQVAMQVADNASRVGEQDVLTARKVYESDINVRSSGPKSWARNSASSIVAG